MRTGKLLQRPLLARLPPWLLPAVGLAVFVHRNFLAGPRGTRPAEGAARRAAGRRLPKLRRAGARSRAPAGSEDGGRPEGLDDAELAERERLDAAGLGGERAMELLNEDEVEALQQASRAGQSALVDMMCRTSRTVAADSDDPGTTDDEEGGGPGPLAPLQGAPAPTITSAPAAQETAGGEEQKQQYNGDKQQQQQQQHWQAPQLQQLRKRRSALQLQLQLPQQQQQQPPSPGTPEAAAPPVAAPPSQGSSAEAEDADSEGGGDYFDHSHYFGLGSSASSCGDGRGRGGVDLLDANGRFVPRFGALWGTSYPPRFDDREWEPLERQPRGPPPGAGAAPGSCDREEGSVADGGSELGFDEEDPAVFFAGGGGGEDRGCGHAAPPQPREPVIVEGVAPLPGRGAAPTAAAVRA